MKTSTLNFTPFCYPQPHFWRCSLALLLLFWSTLMSGQDPIAQVAESLKPNVVALTVTLADGTGKTGFGFITGEKDGQLYLVTAGHVIHGKDAQKPKKIQVKFFSSLRPYYAEEENWFETDDLSLLRMEKPTGLQWQRQFAHFSPQTYQNVRFIGQNGDWLSPGTGEITRIDNKLIKFTIYTIEPGTSGAPLLNEKGIIGLIQEDERISSFALSLSRIKELIGDARFPYFVAELYDPLARQVVPVEDMVLVKGGTFTMGCTSEQGTDCYDWDKPAHLVKVNDFYIGKYEVTQAQWRKVMGSDPPNLNFKGCDQCPVENVSWEEVQEFLRKLNSQTGKKYRLPTEAEWEYAARGGNQSKGYKYAGSNTLSEVSWFTENSDSKTHPVGTKKANELGLYDLNGNVWERCQDWYGDYSSNTQTNPTGAGSGSFRVYRGGGWGNDARYCRVSNRNAYAPSYRGHLGFRLAL